MNSQNWDKSHFDTEMCTKNENISYDSSETENLEIRFVKVPQLQKRLLITCTCYSTQKVCLPSHLFPLNSGIQRPGQRPLAMLHWFLKQWHVWLQSGVSCPVYDPFGQTAILNSLYLIQSNSIHIFSTNSLFISIQLVYFQNIYINIHWQQKAYNYSTKMASTCAQKNIN